MSEQLIHNLGDKINANSSVIFHEAGLHMMEDVNGRPTVTASAGGESGERTTAQTGATKIPGQGSASENVPWPGKSSATAAAGGETGEEDTTARGITPTTGGREAVENLPGKASAIAPAGGETADKVAAPQDTTPIAKGDITTDKVPVNARQKPDMTDEDPSILKPYSKHDSSTDKWLPEVKIHDSKDGQIAPGAGLNTGEGRRLDIHTMVDGQDNSTAKHALPESKDSQSWGGGDGGSRLGQLQQPGLRHTGNPDYSDPSRSKIYDGGTKSGGDSGSISKQ